MGVIDLTTFETLSPFEIKDELIKLAKKTSKLTQSAFLNAGRGNPNWIATTPREGFFLFGQFAITESKRVMEDEVGLGGMPKQRGIAHRLETYLAANSRHARRVISRGDGSLRRQDLRLRCRTSSSTNLVDSIIGDNYPVPDRMLVHNEKDHPRIPDVGHVRRSAPRRQVRPLCGRGRHRRHVLHLQIPQGQSPAEAGRHHRPRHARSSRPTSR